MKDIKNFMEETYEKTAQETKQVSKIEVFFIWAYVGNLKDIARLWKK